MTGCNIKKPFSTFQIAFASLQNQHQISIRYVEVSLIRDQILIRLYMDNIMIRSGGNLDLIRRSHLDYSSQTLQHAGLTNFGNVRVDTQYNWRTCYYRNMNDVNSITDHYIYHVTNPVL